MKAAIDIRTIGDANWQLSNSEFGQVVTGEMDLLLAVDNILFTRKGEMPLDMNAGSNLYKLVDKPMNIIVPGVTAEVIDAINNQEPRLTVDSVTPTFNSDTGGVEFEISLKVVATNQFIGYKLNLSGQVSGRRSFSSEFTNDFG